MKSKKRIAEEDHKQKWNHSYDNYLLKLIKSVGVVAAIIGLAVIAAFWIWVIKMLYKIGA